MVAGLFTVIGAAAVMHSLHLSVPLGAFVAGVMLAESPYRHELESDVEPFRSILLGLFFLSVGMLLDLRLIAQRPLFVLGIAAAVIITKAILITLLDRAFGGNWPNSFRLGLLLSQAGEFGFVMFALATAAQLITREAASLFGAVVTLSMAATPFLMRFIDWLERREVPARPISTARNLSPETSAIVVGYGRFGQTVAQMLQAKRIGVTLIDKKPSMIELAERVRDQGLLWRRPADRSASDRGRRDCAGHRLLQRQRWRRSRARRSTRCSRPFRRPRSWSALSTAVHLIELRRPRPRARERELFESAVVMGRAALEASGIDQREIDRVEREYRMRDCERLERQSRDRRHACRVGAGRSARIARCPTKASTAGLAFDRGR